VRWNWQKRERASAVPGQGEVTVQRLLELLEEPAAAVMSKCLGRFRSQEPLTKRSAKQLCQEGDKKKGRGGLKNCQTLSDPQ